MHYIHHWTSLAANIGLDLDLVVTYSAVQSVVCIGIKRMTVHNVQQRMYIERVDLYAGTFYRVITR